SVFTDNSGAIAFDDEYLVTHKVETHNSPSALDPFGGAVTGIVGVNRDALGFGLGARPVANTYGFCVADPRDTTNLYRDEAKKQPLLPARRILEGVVKGVNAGGNQSGIPTPLGFLAIDPRFRGKPLVFAGTVGLIPRKSKGRNLHEKSARKGDFIVMIGGRVGLDGIHGATFSSEALASGSPATAVQIGDPITQKKFSDAVVREARDQSLYNAITDNGAGGLSSSVSEMARDMKLAGKKRGGCIVELDQVPLKYPGLAPWQIWVSESQERMTLAVPPQKWKALKKVLDRHAVEATKIGVFTDSGHCVVRYKKKKIMDLDMEFLHDGRPVEAQKGREARYKITELPAQQKQYSTVLTEILARPNVGSTAFIAEQYDYEVQSSSVTKPLQGKGRVNADAAVIAPRLGSARGVVLGQGLLPWYSDIDTYAMAAASIDTAVRNAIASGASLNHLAILDNFCWSSSNSPERLWELKRAAKACYDIAVAYGTPFISGKDSMFNDFRGYTEKGEMIHVAAPPTLLVSAIGVIPDVAKAMTFDFKNEGDAIYVLGETHDELGASEYASYLSEDVGKKLTGKEVPQVDVTKNKELYEAFSHARDKGLIASAFSVGRGGLAVALAKASIAGQLGVEVDVRGVPGSARRSEALLFSESQGRMLVSVPERKRSAFQDAMRRVPYAHIGTVHSGSFTIEIPEGTCQTSLTQITEAYRTPFQDW
ncbi:MAG: hypothetical protein RIQ56_46, partial [Candidatus Parcubacteria bacterium]